jgi:hypothetical protein
VPGFAKVLPLTLESSHSDYHVTLQVEGQTQAYTLESMWACHLVFNIIPMKDLIYFFAAILLERKLVFMSKNIHLLTATL